MAKQKWLVDGSSGLYFPIPASTVLHLTPGPGVYKIAQNSDPMDKRIGLLRLFDGDKFEFPGKVYSLGTDDFVERVINCWNSKQFVEQGRNLAVALTGIKGSGKTYLSKLMANKLDMPVLILDNDFEGMVIDFITSLEFECTIIIDEAEKIFNAKNENSHVLLRILDGLNNATRKLYIMTTNEMTIDDNILGRPGRVRYIKQFSSLPAETVLEIIEEELNDKSKTDYVKEIIDLLSISTVDIVRSLIEEVNIFGDIDKSTFSLPLAENIMDVWEFSGAGLNDIPRIEQILSDMKADMSDLISWGNKKVDEDDNEDNRDKLGEKLQQEGIINDSYVGPYRVTSTSRYLIRGDKTSWGIVQESPDKNGYLIINRYGSPTLVRILKIRENPSLYFGRLF